MWSGASEIARGTYMLLNFKKTEYLNIQIERVRFELPSASATAKRSAKRWSSCSCCSILDIRAAHRHHAASPCALTTLFADFHMDPQDALPFLKEPHDALRLGVSTLRDQATVTHPVEALMRTHAQTVEQKRLSMLREVYGSSLPTRMHIERQILQKCRRHPGLPCSNLAQDALSGELDTLTLADYLGAQPEREAAEPSLHSQMERKLGAGTKPVSRGGL